MELPSGQLAVSPAIMCWKKLVEKGAKARSGRWCWGSPGDSTPLPSWAVPCVCQGCQLLHCLSHSLLLFFGWEGTVAQGMWEQFEKPFLSRMCVLGRWWWLLGCAAVRDIKWRHFSCFMAMAVPLLLVSFKYFSCFQELLHTGGYRGPKAILSMIICTSVIFCSHGFFFFAINSTTTSNNISWSAWKKWKTKNKRKKIKSWSSKVSSWLLQPVPGYRVQTKRLSYVSHSEN